MKEDIIDFITAMGIIIACYVALILLSEVI